MQVQLQFKTIVKACALFLMTTSCTEQAPEKADQRPSVPVGDEVLSLMDEKVDPCQDFWHYACGGFVRDTPIPKGAHQVSYTVSISDSRNHDILAKLFSYQYEPMIRAFYDSCMDVESVKKQGNQPIMDELAALSQATTLDDLMTVVAQFHLASVMVFFSIGMEAAFSDPKSYLLHVKPPPINSANAAYAQKIRKALTAVGENPNDAVKVLAFELRLIDIIKGASKRTSRVPLSALTKRVPGQAEFPWRAYFASLLTPQTYTRIQSGAHFFIEQTDYYAKLEELLEQSDLKTLILYMKAQFYLSNQRILASGDETLPTGDDFDVEQTYEPRSFEVKVNGAANRKGHCVEVASQLMWKIIDRYYLEATIGADLIADVNKQVSNIEQVAIWTFSRAPWMDSPSRVQAVTKTRAIETNVAKPRVWPSVRAVELNPRAFFDNFIKLKRNNLALELEKLGADVDRGAFVDSLPLTIWNAYYQVRLNSLTILPSVMQFPTYSPTFGTAMKYGRLGTVAGHELMHAFDSKGRLYNAVGNLRIANGQTLPWWTSETTQIFDSRAQCLVEFYNNVDVVDDVKVDGKKTLPENIADIGGMQFAHTAYRRELTGLGDSLSVVPGLTNDQLFFVSFAQNYCQVSSKDALKKQVKIDVHAPASARVFGVLSNTPEFADAFKCAVNTPYNPTVRCSLL